MPDQWKREQIELDRRHIARKQADESRKITSAAIKRMRTPAAVQLAEFRQGQNNPKESNK